MADVRTIAGDDEIAGFLRCMRTGFLVGKEPDDAMVAWARERWDLDRTWSAFVDGVQCGTTRTFPSRLRLPGLGDVPVSCLTQVTVLPTHTRRGALTGMMRAQLEHAVEAGEAASVLVASEWPIYGRFGYGPYSELVRWEVETVRARVVPPPVGECRIVDPETFEKAAATVFARQQAVTPGTIERDEWYVAFLAGTGAPPQDEPKPSRVRVVHYGDDGEPDGHVVYDPTQTWDGVRSDSSVFAENLTAVDAVAERELWRYLLDIDLVEHVKWHGSPASPIRWALADGRMARQTDRWDHIWARILDVPACLAARSYAASGRVVLEVVDRFLGRGGRFALDVSPEGASCAPAPSATPDVTLPVEALGAAWLGGTDLRQVAAGWPVDGDAERLAVLLRWHETPYCSTHF